MGTLLKLNGIRGPSLKEKIKPLIKPHSLLNQGFFKLNQDAQGMVMKFLKNYDFMSDSKDIEGFIQGSLASLLESSWSMSSVRTLLDLAALCQDKKVEFSKKYSSLLFDDILPLLPKYQTEEYITLRAQHQVNTWPFDDFQENQGGNIKHSHFNLLPATFELKKVNQDYRFVVDLQGESRVSALKLLF